jgi:predicted TPR repeat methyltransferase
MSIGKDFWEKQHKANSGWITGTEFEGLLNQFNLNLDNIKDKRVLEIGTGRGFCAQELSKYASELYCCDISESALDKVKTFATHTYQTADIAQVPAVDLAIAHLVLVHCTDDEMLRIIDGVNLVPGGCFIFQVSGLKDNILTDRAKTTLVDDGSHFFRSVEETQAIIDRSNKQFVTIIGPNDINHAGWFDHQWYYITVKNKI